MSEYTGGALLLDALPRPSTLIGDRGYDSNASRAGLAERVIAACIPPLKHRLVQHPYDKSLCQQRHRVENMFAKLKEWRRIHTRYYRCAHTFLSAVCIAATFLFWINQ